MNINSLETDRLILRPITLKDEHHFFALDSNPKVHLYLDNKPIKTIEESRLIITNILEQYKSNGIGRLAIIHKNTSEFIGWSGLKYEEKLRKEFNYYDIGYRLKEQFLEKGYVTEAALASLDYGFKNLKLKEICAVAHVDNIASNTILKKIDMQPSGTFDNVGLAHN